MKNFKLLALSFFLPGLFAANIAYAQPVEIPQTTVSNSADAAIRPVTEESLANDSLTNDIEINPEPLIKDMEKGIEAALGNKTGSTAKISSADQMERFEEMTGMTPKEFAMKQLEKLKETRPELFNADGTIIPEKATAYINQTSELTAAPAADDTTPATQTNWQDKVDPTLYNPPSN